MYLPGAVLTKYFSLVAAVMTVTAGVPSIECRCPDGRVKLLTLVCVCTSCSSSPVGDRFCSCRDMKRFCGGGPPRVSLQGGINSKATIKALGCVKTLVPHTTVLSPVGSGDSSEPVGDSPVLWEMIPTPFACNPNCVFLNASPEFAVAPPDLPILLCHLAC